MIQYMTMLTKRELPGLLLHTEHWLPDTAPNSLPQVMITPQTLAVKFSHPDACTPTPNLNSQ